MESHKEGLNMKQHKSEKLCVDRRSPLQNLNALHCRKSNSKITSAASIEARNGSMRFSLSSNSSSDTTFPSITHSERKPKTLPKVATNFYSRSFRSKENELPSKPLSEKSNKKQPLCADGSGNGRSKTNSMSKTAQKSKLSCGRENSVKKSSEELQRKTLKGSTRPRTPGVRRNASEESDSRTVNGGARSSTSAKTPPVEVSVSPEIQSKMLGLKSSATPVCYGAGHLLSGVTDKRKCRRRGSLRGGFEKVYLFDDDENVVDDLQDSLIPLPAEASVRWLLSPCKEGEGGEDHGTDSENKVQDFEISSPKAGVSMLSPHEKCEFQSFLENSDKRICDPLLAASPNSNFNYSSSSVSLGDGKNVSGNSSAVSLGSLSSGNIIQTPNSDSSSNEGFRRSNVERSFVKFELDSITETRDVPYAASSRCSFPIQLEKNVDRVCSWESSSTLESLTLSQSQMRISWRDGVECRTDEFDCCPCLSGEEIDTFESKREEKHPWMDNEIDASISPVALEFEPCIRTAPKRKITAAADVCAESMCTDGGGLAVSCDSDWANVEGETPLFQVKK